jgi:hypothetical protein
LVCFYIAHACISCRYIYVQTTIRHVPLTNIVISSTYSCLHGKTDNTRHLCYRTLLQDTATVVLFQFPAPSQGPINNGQIALSWHFSARNTRCHPPIACSPVLVPAFCGAARLANAHLVSECFFRVPPACSRPLFSPSTSAF